MSAKARRSGDHPAVKEPLNLWGEALTTGSCNSAARGMGIFSGRHGSPHALEKTMGQRLRPNEGKAAIKQQIP